MPKLNDYNSPRIPIDWMDSPDCFEMTNAQFREACRLMLDLFRFRKDKQVRIQQHAKWRRRLIAIWGNACVYCGVTDVPLEVEHIIPRTRGGTNAFNNLTLSCRACNGRKRTRTAAEFGYPEVQARAEASRG